MPAVRLMRDRLPEQISGPAHGDWAQEANVPAADALNTITAIR